MHEVRRDAARALSMQHSDSLSMPGSPPMPEPIEQPAR
jgi:hypothetical protein